ncbi:Reverse transcriptase, partial [Phytophthora palmivora]
MPPHNTHVKRKGGAYSGIVWSLPEWTVISAASKYNLDRTVNEAEYHGLLLCLDLLSDMDRGRLIICGDSNLVIRQMRGEIECKAPGLTLLRQQARERLRSWPNHAFLHMKRDWNQSADSLASAALRRESGLVIVEEDEHQDLITLNRLDELLIAKDDAATVKIAAVTSSRKKCRPQVLQEEIAYVQGDVLDLTSAEAKSCSKIADRYETDESGLLVFSPTKQSDEGRDLVAKLAVPETLQNDLIHQYHSSLEGVHQGIGRTFHRSGLTSTGVDKRMTYDPWRITRQFKSYLATAQTVAENYEECVFRRFGASEAIQHDREPGFMSDFFRSFNKIVGQRQRAIMAYHPQSNGATERMVGTLTCPVKMYSLTFALNTAQDRVRGDTPFYLLHGWDPRSTLEATDRREDEIVNPVDGDIVFRSSINKLVGRLTRDYRIQRYNQQVREQVNQRLREAISDRSELHNQEIRPHQIEVGSRHTCGMGPSGCEAIQERSDRHNETVLPHKIEVGTQVWLYLDRVKEGYARKLAHMWHGPFRVLELVDEHAVRLEIAGTEYRLFPV